MAPKCAIAAMPPPCLKLINAMADMGVEVSLEGSRVCVDGRGKGMLINAFHAYQRQHHNWWPATLYVKYSKLPCQGRNDDSRRRYLPAEPFIRRFSSGRPEEVRRGCGRQLCRECRARQARHLLELREGPQRVRSQSASGCQGVAGRRRRHQQGTDYHHHPHMFHVSHAREELKPSVWVLR